MLDNISYYSNLPKLPVVLRETEVPFGREVDLSRFSSVSKKPLQTRPLKSIAPTEIISKKGSKKRSIDSVDSINDDESAPATTVTEESTVEVAVGGNEDEDLSDDDTQPKNFNKKQKKRRSRGQGKKVV